MIKMLRRLRWRVKSFLGCYVDTQKEARIDKEHNDMRKAHKFESRHEMENRWLSQTMDKYNRVMVWEDPHHIKNPCQGGCDAPQFF